MPKAAVRTPKAIALVKQLLARNACEQDTMYGVLNPATEQALAKLVRDSARRLPRKARR